MPLRMGLWEIGIIVLIILIVFGVGKLPQVGSALGKGIRAFKKGWRPSFHYITLILRLNRMFKYVRASRLGLHRTLVFKAY